MSPSVIKFIIKIVLIIGIILTIVLLGINNKKLNNELSISRSNEKAFIVENNELKDASRMFQFTIEQLEYFNDSLMSKINSVRRELLIKDKDIKQLQYLLSIAHKSDTVTFTDTLFIDTDLNIDTIIGDSWYNLNLGLKYPNIIAVDPMFVSEKFIIVNYKKETINPPKKCALGRLFQKKHKIVEVNVIEKNPYIDNEQFKFIEIIK